ncbi:MAG TPA: hypothetical protein VFC31_03405 [Candidatus Limnocylindria bacterium]|nr:hypothetical protein [Candidatus Limnocylindria bacterium]
MVALGKAKAVSKVVLTVRFTQDGDQWLAECVELGTATYADSFEDVQAEIAELIELHLSTLEQTGQRAKFFKEHGIKLYPAGANVPAQVKTDAPVVALGGGAAFSTTYAVPVSA